MLAPSDRYRCVECSRLFGAEGFAYYEGRMENGAAYWCDRGLLCSIECSLAHHRKRLAEGTLPDLPAPDPLDDH
jgi:hypothetical protein